MPRISSRNGAPRAAASWAAGASASVLAIGQLDPRWTAWVMLGVFVGCVGGLAIATARRPSMSLLVAQAAATWATLVIVSVSVALVDAAVHGTPIGPIWDTPLFVAQLVLSVALAAVQLAVWAAVRLRRDGVPRIGSRRPRADRASLPADL